MEKLSEAKFEKLVKKNIVGAVEYIAERLTSAVIKFDENKKHVIELTEAEVKSWTEMKANAILELKLIVEHSKNNSANRDVVYNNYRSIARIWNHCHGIQHMIKALNKNYNSRG